MASFWRTPRRRCGSVIVDFARKRRAERRGGGAADMTLATEILDGSVCTDDDLERVNDALKALETTDPRLKQVVEMRFFGGLTEQEIAEALGRDRPYRAARLGTRSAAAVGGATPLEPMSGLGS